VQWFFIFFIVSGFCSLVYQITWLRVAMANFGVTSASVSIVLSVFMAALALGSWGAGRFVRRHGAGSPRTFLRLYAACEAVIGVSGIVVAPLLRGGHDLLAASNAAAWGTDTYYLASGAMIAVALLPFCTCMGATFPLAMAAVRSVRAGRSATSFSYLYVANVLGAMAGCLGAAFVLIELLGFRQTMLVASGFNFAVALVALLVRIQPVAAGSGAQAPALPAADTACIPREPLLLALLFTTGLASLAMEVVWTRQFVPYLGPVIYTFAAILAIYLGATLLGSLVYRRWFRERLLATGDSGWRILAVLAGTAALFPLVAADYRLPVPGLAVTGMVLVAFGIGPFCMILGGLTPAILDRVSLGDPERAGRAYALNTVGCIVGPLLAGFVLLPFGGERWSLVLLALPLFLLGLWPGRRETGSASGRYLRAGGAALVGVSLLMVTLTRDFERSYPKGVVRRDHTATVIAAGEGMDRELLVNGHGMTALTPITKMMVHIPLASLERPPRTGLVLCMGMGTSFRSMLSWGISTAVVELVPSIPSLLPFYHADGEAVLRDPNGRIVVDDARRFLERTNETFDVIVIDPPPPVDGAATSLLYSGEFYAAAAKRLAPDGILQQWIPGAQGGGTEPIIVAAMAKALAGHFPYVRVFVSVEGWGVHLLASMKPIAVRSADVLAAQLPPRAAADLVEWGPAATPREQFALVLAQERTIDTLTGLDPAAPALSDDRPVNEYFLLRRFFPGSRVTGAH
jgi:spermidine synthase